MLRSLDMPFLGLGASLAIRLIFILVVAGRRAIGVGWIVSDVLGPLHDADDVPFHALFVQTVEA